MDVKYDEACEECSNHNAIMFKHERQNNTTLILGDEISKVPGKSMARYESF